MMSLIEAANNGDAFSRLMVVLMFLGVWAVGSAFIIGLGNHWLRTNKSTDFNDW